MASINLKGYLRETLGALSVGNKIRFTHASTTGETIAGSVTNYTVPDDGYYDINIEYGNVFIETSDKDSRSWQVHGTTTINADTAATTLPTLLNSVVPPTNQQILLFQSLVADAENARDASEASAVRSETAAQTSTDNTILMTASEHDAILAQNEASLAASGMMQTGKHGADAVNEGMYTDTTTPNVIMIGGGSNGASKTTNSVMHIAGSVSELSVNSYLLPPEPDGTVTFNGSTGANVTHADVATAFAAAAADPDVEVVTDRVDAPGLEQFDMVGDEIFDMVQSQSATFGDTDVPTVDSTLPDSFFAAYDGQTGITKGKCVKWSTLTDVQKRKVAAYMKERLWLDIDGNVKFTTIVQDSKRGLGNGDWFNINPANGALEFKSGEPVLSRAGFAFVKDEDRQGVFTDNNGSYYYVLGTVSRLNTGAFAKGANESGGMAFSDGNKWSSTVDSYATQLECFQNAHTTLSGRDDDRLPQYIYADGLGGVVDCRLSAYAMSSPEESSKVWEKVKNGTYRGLEKLFWTNASDTQQVHGVNGHTIRTNVRELLGRKATAGEVYYFYTNGSASLSGEIIGGVARPLSSDLDWIEAVGLEGKVNNGAFANQTVIVTSERSTSVSGNFTMTDVIGDPANILLTDALKNGWQGSWIPKIPSTGSGDDNFALNRKAVLSNATRVLSTDNGASWASAGFTIGTTQNNINSASSNTTGNISILTYTAFAKQTKPSTNKAVFNGEAGVGSVYQTCSFSEVNGNLLAESTIGKVMTSDSFDSSVGSLGVTYVSVDPSNKISSQASYGEPRHNPLTLGAPSNNSPAVKALPYQISDNGQCSIGVQANELTYGTPTNVVVITPANAGTTNIAVGTLYKVRGDVAGALAGRIFIGDTASVVPINDSQWIITADNKIRHLSNAVVYGELVNSESSWGDDSTIVIQSSGSDTFVDLNGNVNLSTVHELSIPIGWSHNRSRVGTQVEGVDL